ncbi:MAG: hypothetical protein ACKVOA_05235 [Methylophilaceae bacterium]
MKFVNAILIHAWLALSLRHDGTGLPQKLPAAFMLASLYIALSLANSHVRGDFNYHSIIGLSFVAQFYIFLLRDKVVGLILLIGAICNAFSLTLGVISNTSELAQILLSLMEFVMIFGAMINIILNLERHST